MMASITHALLRALASDFPDPSKCLAKLNKLLTSRNPEMLFVTMLYCVLDRRTGAVAYANAGHPWPLKLAADGAVAPLSGEVGIPVGIRDDAIWSTASIALSPGDRLLLYTDGLSETTSPAGEQYGDARMRERLHALTLEPSDELMRQMIAGIDEFRGATAVVDDMTCLILDWRGAHPPGSCNPPVDVAHSA